MDSNENNIDHINIREVSKDIIAVKFKGTDTLDECLAKFYDIMRKHNIKQGTVSYDNDGNASGRTCNNYEWTICKNLFQSQLDKHFEWIDLLDGVPEDLKC